jgi:hypothetical protein
MSTICCVYWLFDAGCSLPEKDGYIGITRELSRRIRIHRRSKRFPAFNVKVLFEGSRHECSALEFNLRPQIGIGWNFGTGGKSTHGTLGKTLSATTRKKMRLAHKRRSPKEKARLAKLFSKLSKGNKSRTGQKSSAETRAKLSAAGMGNKNAVGNKNALGAVRSKELREAISKRMKGKQLRLGAKLSDETKRKIGSANKGKLLGNHHNKNWLINAKRNEDGTWKSNKEGN